MAGSTEIRTGFTATGAQRRGSPASDNEHKIRRFLAWTLGTAGLLSYSWWVLVPLKPGLMRSPDELFSNLEVTGQPFAAAMQHADFAAGLLLVGAIWAAGYGNRPGRLEWLAMLGFGVSGALGGLFPETCADGVNLACRRMEVHFQLPASHYIHMAVGIFEFFFITVALACAVLRTRGQHTGAAVWCSWRSAPVRCAGSRQPGARCPRRVAGPDRLAASPVVISRAASP